MLETTALSVVWRHRALLWALTRRDIQNRYAGSVAGALWALLHPLALLALYAVVFEAVFKVKVPNLSLGQPYVLFIALALWPWMAFQEAVMRGTTSVQQNGALVKKVAFDHELLIYSAVMSSFAVHGVGFAVVMVVLGVLGFNIQWVGLFSLLAFVPVLLLMALVLALLLGALQVFLRDVEQLLSQVMSVLFYATPILFPMAIVPGWLAEAMHYNPLVHVIEPLRNGLLGQGSLDAESIAWVALVSVIAFAVARAFFLRLSPYFEDMV
jgi:ABC-type polysaccharide/polyol phosphate export permease